jgi:hypothetical protein
LALGCGGFLAFNALRNRQLHAWVGTEGVALLKGDTVRSMRWENVETLRDARISFSNTSNGSMVLKAMARGEDHVLTLESRNGKELVFKNFFDDLAGLAEILERETLPHLHREAQALLDEKGQVPFGPIVIKKEGIAQKEGEIVRWPKVKSIANKGGKFQALVGGKRFAWFSCLQGEIPSLHVLMSLADEYLNNRE